MANDDPRGNVLFTRDTPDGMTHVVLDNGPTSVISLLMLSTMYDDFGQADPKVIHKLLHKPEPGARNKRKKTGR